MAIEATFSHRKTNIENRFFIYEQAYISEKAKLWKSFLKKIGSNESANFSEIIDQIKAFLEAVIVAKKSEMELVWDSRDWRWRISD